MTTTNKGLLALLASAVALIPVADAAGWNEIAEKYGPWGLAILLSATGIGYLAKFIAYEVWVPWRDRVIAKRNALADLEEQVLKELRDHSRDMAAGLARVEAWMDRIEDHTQKATEQWQQLQSQYAELRRAVNTLTSPAMELAHPARRRQGPVRPGPSEGQDAGN